MSNKVDLSGYHLTFDDEFDSAADLAPFSNTYFWGGTTISNNGELENYIPSNATSNNPFSVSGGALTITASPTPSGGLPYSSGLLTTQNTFSQNTGYFEIRAEIPAGAGFWPAFWMLPEGGGYPEIDILEQPNNSGTNTDYWTHTSTPTDNNGGFNNTGIDVFAGYHTYGFLWTATTIQYTFDGQLIGTADATPAALASLQLYLLADLAVGGWPGTPPTGASSTYNIDYIRAYSNDPGVPAVTPEAVSNPDLIGATVGSGPDALVLEISEDAYLGDAQFTVSVDGVRQGGVLTVTASLASGQAQAFTVLGSFGTSQHTVTVNFLNDAYGGSATLDRNLYVDDATINGTPVPNAILTELSNGPQSFAFTGNDAATATVTPTGPVNPAPVTLGTGTDQLVLSVAEDQYLGDAQFIVSVDNVQVGGVQTVTAQQALGQTQQFVIDGSFGTSQHTVTVNFTNDAYGGAPTLDRNLYVTGATIGGVAVPNATLTELGGGPQSFTFTGNDPATVTTPAAPVTPVTINPAPVTLGTGTDQLVLAMSEDYYLADAQFTVSVDGVQQGGLQTVTAQRALGQTQQFIIDGSFGTSQHTIAVDFVNDAYGGSAALDRNLYVSGATINGTSVANAALTELSNGTQNFSFTGNDPATAGTTPAGPVNPSPVTIGTGTDQLVLTMSEDAYLGDAQFTVAVDNVQVGGTLTTTALRDAGQQQAFTVLGNFGAGSHTVSVNFLNDAYGGNALLDRNLYVNTATIDGSVVPNAGLTELGNGPQSFNFTEPSSVVPQTIPDTLTVSLTEDAYLGDAVAAIAIDGTTLATPTVTFLNSGSTAEVFTYTADLGGANLAHNVAVSFLNDAYGGSASLDRNLYVKGLSFDGVSYADQGTLLSNGTLNFAIPALPTSHS